MPFTGKRMLVISLLQSHFRPQIYLFLRISPWFAFGVKGGFAFLPFLWLVNVVWFFKEAFVKPAYTEQPQIKTYVKRSALGLLLWVAVLTTWISIFQHFRAQWGEVADYLSFTIPLGMP
ncbi:gamma-secretase subunit PEN-2 isoform X1 [Electrophorus electricus]|uniref:Gamma-secretase subunit PEN-2 n=1 Tax=Electrophorus electricus TaxID=8005 RepID=A0A4W4GSG0_ELEEL|nr:gamma-secretase subunit PEN-2 isoform X1 [Electrophorus electricus]